MSSRVDPSGIFDEVDRLAMRQWIVKNIVGDDTRVSYLACIDTMQQALEANKLTTMDPDRMSLFL